MKVKTIKLCVCLVLLLGLALACKLPNANKGGDAQTEHSGNGNPGSGTPSPSPLPAPTPSNEHIFYGTIDGKRVEMKLARDGAQMSGSYFYRKIGTPIPLKGSVDAQNKLSLQEFGNGPAQPSGYFNAKWDDSDKYPAVFLDGYWSKTGTEKKSVYFVAMEQNIEPGVQFETKTISQSDKKLKLDVMIEYPQITAAANENAARLNLMVKSFVEERLGAFRKDIENAESDPAETDTNSGLDINYDVVLATDEIVCIMMYVSEYEAGAAHPSTASKTFNFSLKDGRELKLVDLFKSGSGYLQLVSKYCIGVLSKREDTKDAPDMIEEGAKADDANYQSWNLSRKGLVIVFDPYQVGPYAIGTQFVTIPFSVLGNATKPDGPIDVAAR